MDQYLRRFNAWFENRGAMRGLPYDVKALLQKARESALLAVETYNRPTANFRSGAYVVLMVIAWTSLFHAVFLQKRIKPFYRKKNSTRYEKLDGEPKRWELKECLHQYHKNDNPSARKNLEFFIGLRNKIEHSSLAQLDSEIFGECQAMLLNFDALLISEFGDRYAIRGGLTFALQFSKVIPKGQSTQTAKSQKKAFKAVKQYVDEFRSSLSTEIQNDLAYSFKVYLVPKIGNQASKDAVAVEWIKYDPSKPEEMKHYEKVVAMIKPKEVQIANLGLLKPSKVANEIETRLGRRFTAYDHKLCYQHFQIRPPKGAPDPYACNAQFCVYDDLHKDYGYTPEWVTFLSEKLGDAATYDAIIATKKKTNLHAHPVHSG
ncbi:MAG: DUF3644 domain-containing protein [Vicinamibacteria bacterium]